MPDPRGPVTAVVPFRSPGEGLTRLDGLLLRADRAALASAMLADVVRALRGGGVARVVVAASGPGAVATARALGVDVTIDPPSTRGLDDAVRAAAARLGPGGALLVALADLPLLRSDDVARALQEDAQVVVAATDDGGTGLLLRRPARVIDTAYGAGSAARHLRLGRLADVTATALDLPGVRLDVDGPADLAHLLGQDVGGATGAILARLGPRLRRLRDRADA